MQKVLGDKQDICLFSRLFDDHKIYIFYDRCSYLCDKYYSLPNLYFFLLHLDERTSHEDLVFFLLKNQFFGFFF